MKLPTLANNWYRDLYRWLMIGTGVQNGSITTSTVSTLTSKLNAPSFLNLDCRDGASPYYQSVQE